VPAKFRYNKPDLCEIGNNVTKREALILNKRVPCSILNVLSVKTGTIQLDFFVQVSAF
jgi:hypothetical protein